MKPRVLSKKKILNISSTKKRDKMLSVTNTTLASGAGAVDYAVGPAIVTGNRQALFVWCPTARGGVLPLTNGGGFPIDQAVRERTTVFMKGLSEKITLSTNDSCTWLWRRIVFYSRDPGFRAVSTNGSSQTTYAPFFYGSNGYQRVLNQPVNGGFIDSQLWAGTFSRDWSDFMTAKVDNRRVDLKYDKVITINPGSSGGVTRHFTRWHGMNKNLVYDDDEFGGDEVTSSYSVTDKRGMGDCYVVDIFQSGAGRAEGTNSQLYFRPEATLYWHEK